MKSKTDDTIAGQTRDPFTAAKDVLLDTVFGHPSADEKAMKVWYWMVREHANRQQFEASGRIAAWPSMRTLASETGLTKSRVQGGIERLEVMGVLQVERPDKRGAGHHNKYSLSTEWLRDRREIEKDIAKQVADERHRWKSKNVREDVDNKDAEVVRDDTDIRNHYNVRAGGDGMPARANPNLLDDPLEVRSEGAGAPSGAPQAPPASGCDPVTGHARETVGFGADGRADPPFYCDEEPIIDPPGTPHPTPEPPASLELAWREAEDRSEPPEPRHPEDDPRLLEEIESLLHHTGAEDFVALWSRAFIGGDAASAGPVVACVARAARFTAKAFATETDAVVRFLIDPLTQNLAGIAEGRGYDPEAIDDAVSDFLVVALALPEAPAQGRRAAHG